MSGIQLAVKLNNELGKAELLRLPTPEAGALLFWKRSKRQTNGRADPAALGRLTRCSPQPILPCLPQAV